MIFTGSPSSVKPCATPQINEAPTRLRVAAETESAFEDVKALTEWSSRSRPFVQVSAERVAHVGGVRFAARDGLETPDSDGEENARRAPHFNQAGKFAVQTGRSVRRLSRRERRLHCN